MVRFRFAFLVVGAAIALASDAAAQARPNFSGRWQISQAKSSAGAVGNSANVPFASELVVAQQPSEMRVEMHFPRTVKPVSATYTFDGTEVPVETPPGITERAKAAWDGNKLVVTARRVVSSQFGEFVTDTKETWSVAGDVLTIVKSQSSEGLTLTETAVFERQK